MRLDSKKTEEGAKNTFYRQEGKAAFSPLAVSLKSSYGDEKFSGIEVPFERERLPYSESMFVSLELRSKEGEGGRSIDYTELASLLESKDGSPQHMWLEGAAGMGKTTLTRYMLYKWAVGDIWQTYEVVLYLPMRHIVRFFEAVESVCGVAQFISQLEEKDNWGYYAVMGKTREHGEPILGKAEVSMLRLLLTTAEGRSKILLVLEGLDEIDIDHPLLKNLMNSSFHWLVATRPQAKPEWLSVGNLIEVKTLGFNKKSIAEYIESYYRRLSKRGGRDEKGLMERLVSLHMWIKKKKEMDLFMAAPLNCHLTCVMSSEGKLIDSPTLTELYDEMLILWIKIALTKSKRMRKEYEIRCESCDNVYKKVQSIRDKELLEKSKSWLVVLEKISYLCLKEGNSLTVSGKLVQGVIEQLHKKKFFDNYIRKGIAAWLEKSSILREGFTSRGDKKQELKRKAEEEYEEMTTEQVSAVIKDLLCFGIMKPRGLSVNLLEDSFEFGHKTFPEYMAGRLVARLYHPEYVSSNPDASDINTWLFPTWGGAGFYLDLSLMLRFASGTLNKLVKNGGREPSLLRSWIDSLTRAYYQYSYWGSGPLLHLFSCLLEINENWSCGESDPVAAQEISSGESIALKEKRATSITSIKVEMMGMLWSYVRCHTLEGVNDGLFDGKIARLWGTAYQQIRTTERDKLEKLQANIRKDSLNVEKPKLQDQAKKALELMDFSTREVDLGKEESDNVLSESDISKEAWVKVCLDSEKHLGKYLEKLVVEYHLSSSCEGVAEITWLLTLDDSLHTYPVVLGFLRCVLEEMLRELLYGVREIDQNLLIALPMLVKVLPDARRKVVEAITKGMSVKVSNSRFEEIIQASALNMLKVESYLKGFFHIDEKTQIVERLLTHVSPSAVSQMFGRNDSYDCSLRCLQMIMGIIVDLPEDVKENILKFVMLGLKDTRDSLIYRALQSIFLIRIFYPFVGESSLETDRELAFLLVKLISKSFHSIVIEHCSGSNQVKKREYGLIIENAIFMFFTLESSVVKFTRLDRLKLDFIIVSLLSCFEKVEMDSYISSLKEAAISFVSYERVCDCFDEVSELSIEEEIEASRIRSLRFKFKYEFRFKIKVHLEYIYPVMFRRNRRRASKFKDASSSKEFMTLSNQRKHILKEVMGVGFCLVFFGWCFPGVIKEFSIFIFHILAQEKNKGIPGIFQLREVDKLKERALSMKSFLNLLRSKCIYSEVENGYLFQSVWLIYSRQMSDNLLKVFFSELLCDSAKKEIIEELLVCFFQGDGNSSGIAFVLMQLLGVINHPVYQKEKASLIEKLASILARGDVTRFGRDAPVQASDIIYLLHGLRDNSQGSEYSFKDYSYFLPKRYLGNLKETFSEIKAHVSQITSDVTQSRSKFLNICSLLTLLKYRKYLLTQLSLKSLMHQPFYQRNVPFVVRREFMGWHLPRVIQGSVCSEYQLIEERSVKKVKAMSSDQYALAIQRYRPPEVLQGLEKVKELLVSNSPLSVDSSGFFKSILGRYPLDDSWCSITLVRNQGKEHAYLILERRNSDGKRKIMRAELKYFEEKDELKIDYEPVEEKRLKELNKKPYFARSISHLEYDRAEARIKADKERAEKGKIKYHLLGRDPNQSKSKVTSSSEAVRLEHIIEYHNCLSWAYKVLDEVDPALRRQIPKNPSFMKIFRYAPSSILPSLHRKGVSVSKEANEDASSTGKSCAIQ